MSDTPPKGDHYPYCPAINETGPCNCHAWLRARAEDAAPYLRAESSDPNVRMVRASFGPPGAERDARGDERIARLNEAVQALQGMLYQLDIVTGYVRDALDVPSVPQYTAAAATTIRAIQTRLVTASARLDAILRDHCPECGHEITGDHDHARPDRDLEAGCQARVGARLGGGAQGCPCKLPPTFDAMYAGTEHSWGGRRR